MRLRGLLFPSKGPHLYQFMSGSSLLVDSLWKVHGIKIPNKAWT
jgi:hypothetical protein